MLVTTEANVTYPVTIIKVNGVKGRSHLDTECKTIETLTNSTTKKLKIYNLKVENLDENFSFQTELNKLEREVLITLPNPKYNEMIETYNHFNVIKMDERYQT